MSTNADVRAQLAAYLADELGERERAPVEQALAQSASLRAEAERYQQTFALLAALSLDEVVAPRGLDARIIRQVAVEWYLGAAARWLEDLAGAYGRAFVHYLRLR